MGAGLKPVAAEVKETMIRPVTRRGEQYEEKERAVDTRSIKKVCADEEEEDKRRRGICRNEEER